MKIELTVTYKNRLQELMAREGFRNMQALAEETGISRNMLYLFERGESHLTAPNLIRLLWVLDCNFENLITYDVATNEPEHLDDLSDAVKAKIDRARQVTVKEKQQKSPHLLRGRGLKNR